MYVRYNLVLPVLLILAMRAEMSVLAQQSEWRVDVGLSSHDIAFRRDSQRFSDRQAGVSGDMSGHPMALQVESGLQVKRRTADLEFGQMSGVRLESFVSVVADSLPAGMPLHTRMLWGNRGLIRAVGLAPSWRRGEFMLRRSMLQWHQRMGLVTFGLLTTQVVMGELMARNPARHYENIRPYHKGMGYVSTAAYFTTAGLSLGAPPAWRYNNKVSSIRIHRWLAVIHLAGMVSQPFLGRSLAHASSGESYDRRLNRHRWVGRVTWISFTSALITTFLP